jgi:hypothetical protein
MLQDAIPPVNNIIDIINYFYPFMKLDENNEFVPLPQNATLRDIISKSFLYESDNFVIFKTGIYNLYTENKQPVIWRNNVPTALFEIHLALNLVKLSYNEIVLNENVFENNPFPQTYNIISFIQQNSVLAAIFSISTGLISIMIESKEIFACVSVILGSLIGVITLIIKILELRKKWKEK